MYFGTRCASFAGSFEQPTTAIVLISPRIFRISVSSPIESSISKACLPVKVSEGVRDERSEEHTSELQSRLHLVCRLLLEKKTRNRHPPRPPGSPDARSTSVLADLEPRKRP